MRAAAPCLYAVIHITLLFSLSLLLATAEPLGSAVPLCVANTHLFWDPDYADVKLWQVHMLTQEVSCAVHEGKPRAY